MNGRRLAIGAAIAALVVALGWAMFAALGRQLAAPTPDAEPAAAPAPAPASAGPQIAATLYFVSEDGASLVGVSQDVPLGGTPVEQARALVEAQLAAEPPAPLARAVPAGVALRGVFLPGGDDAYVDLDAAVVTGTARRIAQRAARRLRHRVAADHQPLAGRPGADPGRRPRGRHADRSCGLARALAEE